MNNSELESLLKGTKYERFIGLLNSVELQGFQYSDLFKIGNENTGFFALKVRRDDNKSILESIENLSLINDSDNFINKTIDVMEKDGFIMLISDWLDGFQPIDSSREHLPEFFSRLAYFNKQNIVKGPFTSMYAEDKIFETTEELINWEINDHKKYLQGITETKEITVILNNLHNGISCIILEDMNTGNLFITDNGKYKYIDTDWVVKGLNLYQFEKLDYFGFEERKWYNIFKEAKDCYAAYFEELGVKTEEANEQIRAFELLQVLRTNTYVKYHGEGNCDDNDKEISRRINIVKEKDRFI